MINKRYLTSSFLLVFLVSSFLIPTVKAFEYGGFGLRPADLENGTVRKSDSAFSYDIDLGSSKRDGLMVINNTKVKKTFSVYAADSVSSTDGGFACKQFGENKIEVGSWIKLDKNEVELDPGTNEIIPFTISIPAKTDSGEHDGCFLIQEKKDDTVDKNNKKSGIQLSIRTGVRVSITIPGDLIKKISLGKFEISNKQDGSFVFNSSIKNSGNVSVNTDVNVIVKNILGITHKTVGGEFIVLRGETSVWNFELPKPFWGGFYTARLVAKYNPNIKGDLKDESKLKILESEKEISFFSFPTAKGLMFEIIILLFITFNIYLLSIWKKRQNWIGTWKKHTVARATNIKVLAEKYEVNWKLLASVNKIKAPYMVDSKDEIKVPDDLEEDYNKKRISMINKVKSITSPKKKLTKKKKTK